MTVRRLLFLDASHLTAYRWQSGGLHEEASFSPDKAGLAAFDEYLHRQRSSLFYLLADVADEGFQIEEVPYVQGSDRQELFGRKLAQYYYGTPLSLAISLGRRKQGRRDERVLFTGLTGYPQFEPWLRAMREADTQLAGVFSMPLVLAGMIGKLAGSSEQILLMSVTRAGLRQTFFDQGQLRFSRLTPMATGMIGEVANACATETKKIYQYLAGQRLISRDQPLKTLVLAHPTHFDIIGDRCRNTPERKVLLVDLAAEAKKHGLAPLPQDSRGDALFLHLLAKRTPPHQFAPAEERRLYRLWQTRFAINAVTTGIIAACMLFAGSQMASQADLAERNSTLQTEVELGKRRYNNMLQELPPVPISYDSLRTLTARFEALSQRSPGPEPILQHLSRALGEAPRIELMTLDWWIANQPNEEAQANGTKISGGNPPATGNGYAVVRMLGQLPLAMASDHRSQLETVNAFVGNLATSGIQVQVISLPFETESGKSIRSSEASGQVDPPRFVLKMVQKL